MNKEIENLERKIREHKSLITTIAKFIKIFVIKFGEETTKPADNRHVHQVREFDNFAGFNLTYSVELIFSDSNEEPSYAGSTVTLKHGVTVFKVYYLHGIDKDCKVLTFIPANQDNWLSDFISIINDRKQIRQIITPIIARRKQEQKTSKQQTRDRIKKRELLEEAKRVGL